MFKIFSRKKKKDAATKKPAITLQQMLNQSFSFKSFCNYNEVFDMHKRTLVTKKNDLFQLYECGIGIDSPHFIINKN